MADAMTDIRKSVMFFVYGRSSHALKRHHF